MVAMVTKWLLGNGCYGYKNRNAGKINNYRNLTTTKKPLTTETTPTVTMTTTPLSNHPHSNHDIQNLCSPLTNR